MPVQALKHPQPVSGGPSERLSDRTPVLLSENLNLPYLVRRLAGDLHDSMKKESEPAFPITVVPHRLQALIVLLAISREIVGEVERRFA